MSIVVVAGRREFVVVQAKSSYIVANTGLKGEKGDPGSGSASTVTFVTTATYTTLETDDFIAARVNEVGAPIAITFDTDVDSWPIGKTKEFSDFDLNCAARNITLDAGSGKVIRGVTDDQTYVLKYNGQSCSIKRLTATVFKVM